jgi:hypothetical protein
MVKSSPLENSEYAGFAWKRYWRLMRWMFLFTIGVTIAALSTFYWNNGLVSIHFYIATAFAISASLLLASALMGLVFLSSGTGHDDAIEDPFAEGEQD